ncbi:ABC transporter ATP-binding protein [Sinomonas cyclohexanicum]|nr:ABC transporter ATP-binding protein [Corynebacterium cyclohexanicum]
MLIEDLRTALGLVQRPFLSWAVPSVLGSLLIAGLDTAGVAAMVPLMQAVTGAPTTSGPLGLVAQILGTQDLQSIVLFVALMVMIAFALKSGLTIVFRWWQLGIATGLEAEASKELMSMYINAPYWAHRSRKLAEVHRNIASAVPQAFGQVAQGILNWITDALTLVALVAVLFIVSPLATALAAALFVGCGWGIQRVFRHRYHALGSRIAEADMQSWNALLPGVNGFREVRLAQAGELFVERFGEAKTVRAHAQRTLSLISELPKYVLEIVFVLGIGGVAAVLFAIGPASTAISVLGVFAAGSTRVIPTINRLTATSGSIRSGGVGLHILAAEIRLLKSEGTFIVAQPSKIFSGDVTLDNLSFSFSDSSEPVLRGISTTLAEGRTTAFVGSSGAGKSTLLDLVLGLLEPSAGVVTCGGHDIREDLASWYSGIGVVPQDVFLLDDTLEANIAFGHAGNEVDHDLMFEAIKLAQLEDVISELPDGLDTRLGERGIRVSGGQRQRVGIARALYRRPRILVLDEATSALDNATEHRITETLEALAGRMTVLVVAHRLSTVRNADKVVFLSAGQIEVEGSFSEVEASSLEFADLVALGKL